MSRAENLTERIEDYKRIEELIVSKRKTLEAELRVIQRRVTLGGKPRESMSDIADEVYNNSKHGEDNGEA